jgi:UPF0716 protein FxsA
LPTAVGLAALVAPKNVGLTLRLYADAHGRHRQADSRIESRDDFWRTAAAAAEKDRYDHMIFRLFLLFTLVPLIELYLLIRIGAYLGAVNTILIVVITGILGAFLARLEGVRTMRQISLNLSNGIVPAEELVDGVIIFIAGVLLVTPGVLTDIFGLFLLLPHTRNIFKRGLRRKFDRMVASGNFRLHFRSGNWDNS